MELGTVLSVAQTLYDALQSAELKDLCSVWGYESELENLGRKVSVVNAVLLDAESKREHVELSHQTQLWVDELRDVVFDADDLLDRFVTLSEQKQLMDLEGGGVFRKVCHFFSRSNPLLVAVNMYRGVKEIKDRLDGIAGDHLQFGFKLDCQPIRTRRDETCSYVYAKNIVGRESDKENIVRMLLDPSCKKAVSFVAIVGIGGLGKTTLAQLVYNDPRVEKEFPLRMWTCVAGEDQKRLDVKTTLVKILQSATGQRHEDLMGKSLECLQRELQQQLTGNKYLLVLDDTWNEDHHQWGNLVEFFMGGLLGSWVVLTTRSKITASIVGDGLTYELSGLSEEDSWHLFQMTAFGQEWGGDGPPDDIVTIGRDIVKRCANVPLALRVVGSLLYGHGREKWRSFQEIGIGGIRRGGDAIEPILKLSYLHLETPLKVCFSFCGVFPKGYVLEKDTLISLWMAQGYIIPLEEGQILEDAGEEYFSILLKRCFFHDVELDEYGEIVSCKMHDLMHDIAQQVAGKEISASSITRNIDNKVRHFYHLDTGEFFGLSSTRNKIRTYLRESKEIFPTVVGEILVNWTCLRALDLRYSMIESLPDTLGWLFHLRYLDLSGNPGLFMLPRSITELHNLQTLKLRGCLELLQLPENLGRLVKLRFLDLNGLNIEQFPGTLGKLSQLAHLDLSGNDRLHALPESIMELHDLQTLRLRCCDNIRDLPRDMSKLVKLKVLDITGCWQLDDMPYGMGRLSSLQTLPLFVVSSGHSSSNTDILEKLEDLKALSNLNGHLELRFNISENATYVKRHGWEGNYLRNKQHLKHIIIDFSHGDGDCSKTVDYEEALLEDLQPHSNLKGLRLSGYSGKKIPSWASEHYLSLLLPNLVKVHLVSCDGLQSLTSLGRLPCLKSLILEQLSDLEYVETASSYTCSSNEGASGSESGLFFPSLERLTLDDLPKLKEWWRYDRTRNQQCSSPFPSFPRLVELHIWSCPKLTDIPLCPTVETLKLGKCDRRLRIMGSQYLNSQLMSVYTEDVQCLKSALPPATFLCLEKMEIRDDEEVESLTEVWQLFQRCSSLHSLIIDSCPRLKSVSRGLVHLTALVTLHMINMPRLKLNVSGDGEDGIDGLPWSRLNQNLRSLSLDYLPKMADFPKGIRHLTALQSLFIRNCRGLNSLPEFMKELISLEQLEIVGCSPILKKRCETLTGTDWPNIRHIPHFLIDQEADDGRQIAHQSDSDSENDVMDCDGDRDSESSEDRDDNHHHMDFGQGDDPGSSSDTDHDLDMDFDDGHTSGFSSDTSSVHCL